MQVSNLVRKGTCVGGPSQRKPVHSARWGRQVAPVKAVPNLAGPSFTELAQDLSSNFSPEVRRLSLSFLCHSPSPR
eukprot:1159715-Pelagomonas_calceolata.AAC.13